MSRPHLTKFHADVDCHPPSCVFQTSATGTPRCRKTAVLRRAKHASASTSPTLSDLVHDQFREGSCRQHPLRFQNRHETPRAPSLTRKYPSMSMHCPSLSIREIAFCRVSDSVRMTDAKAGKTPRSKQQACRTKQISCSMSDMQRWKANSRCSLSPGLVPLKVFRLSPLLLRASRLEQWHFWLVQVWVWTTDVVEQEGSRTIARCHQKSGKTKTKKNPRPKPRPNQVRRGEAKASSEISRKEKESKSQLRRLMYIANSDRKSPLDSAWSPDLLLGSFGLSCQIGLASDPGF